MSRAAVFVAGAALAGAAAAAACGGTQSQQQGAGDDLKNMPVQADAGAAEPPPAEPDAQPVEQIKPPPPDHDVPMPYGAPPARERLV